MTKLLLPCDGRANSLLAVHEAIAEFRRDPTLQIHLLNVQPPFSAHITRHVSHEARSEFHREHAQEAVAPALQLLDAAQVPCTLHIDVGDQADCIVACARRLQCDRIMVATSRKSPLVRAVENSLTSRLIERADVPVEVIAGASANLLERIGVPAGVGAGLTLLWITGS